MYAFYGSLIKVRLKEIAPWKWALVFLWFATKLYASRSLWMSDCSYFDLILSFNPGWHQIIDATFLFVFLFLFAGTSLFRPESTSIKEDVAKPHQWVIGSLCFILVCCFIVLVLYLLAGLLLFVLYLGPFSFTFANHYSAQLWDGLPWKPEGSLYSAFSRYLLNLYLYCTCFSFATLLTLG